MVFRQSWLHGFREVGLDARTVTWPRSRISSQEAINDGPEAYATAIRTWWAIQVATTAGAPAKIQQEQKIT